MGYGSHGAPPSTPIGGDTFVTPFPLAPIRLRAIDAKVAKARELGGTIIAEPFPVPTVDRLAVVSGPDGSTFGVAQWEMLS